MHADKDDMQNHEHAVSQSGLCIRLQLPETLSSAVLASGARVALGATSDELAASSAASSLITPLLLVCRNGKCMLFLQSKEHPTGHRTSVPVRQQMLLMAT